MQDKREPLGITRHNNGDQTAASLSSELSFVALSHRPLSDPGNGQPPSTFTGTDESNTLTKIDSRAISVAGNSRSRIFIVVVILSALVEDSKKVVIF